MDLLLTGGEIFQDGEIKKENIAIHDGHIVSIDKCHSLEMKEIQISGLLVVPGFVDMHVHLREPGFSYKETIASGSAAAAAGGYTTVCAMPNLKPTPDHLENLKIELDIIQRDAKINVLPYGCITKREEGKELSDFPAMADYVAGFSDDGRGVQSKEIMRQAMILAQSLSKPIVAHCEDESLLSKKWAVHNGEFAKRWELIGNPSESEWRQVERDLNLVKETGCQYHVCHVSTKESVELIRNAKKQGLPVTCETAPHYLLLCDEDLQDDGKFKMNPPIRTAADRKALIAGLLDGTVDCIATDHAPHSKEEKAGGLRNSLNGIVGLETAFPVLYTYLVKTGLVPLEILLNALCTRPREILSLRGGQLKDGESANLTILNLNTLYNINSASFYSMGRATPFDGWEVSAAIVMTICNGKIVYEKKINI